MNASAASINTFEHWQSSLLAACGYYDTHLSHQSSLFIGEIRDVEDSRVPLAYIKTNAGLISKRYRPDRNDDRYCFLVSQRSGYTRVDQDGRTINLSPGDVFIMDSASSCDIVPMGLIEHVSISLPREQVARSLTDRKVLFGKVDAGSLSGSALKLIINQLCHQELLMNESQQETEAMMAALCCLLSSSLQNSDVSHLPELMGHNHLFDQVRRIIDDCLPYNNLTPVMIARRAGISVRRLYRLFEDQGESVCRYIQRTRLQHSADDLANLTSQNESITAIAHKWGFTDSAHFSRSFKKEFSLSPREYRKKILS